MFERYTENARRLIFFARYEASQFGSPYIDTEHLLLAYFRDQPRLIAQYAPGLNEDATRKAISARSGRREYISTSVDLPLSDACKRVLGYAAEEAEQLKDRHIRPEHLLLGLLREEKSLASQLLRDAGAQVATIREPVQVTEAKQQHAAQSFYCASCNQAVGNPLTCGDCSAVICRVCGTPLEMPEELGIG